MNFYKHYLGDYARDTAHLTITEHGAYRLMLDHYYATRRPLPADISSLYRICHAMSKVEKKAVFDVANWFFPINGDGTRHNKRADQEIAAWEAKSAINKEIGKLGGRPKETQTITERVSKTNPEETLTRYQIPEKEVTTLSGKPDVKALAVEVLDFLNQKAGRAYRPTPANLGLIEARLKEGATVADCRMVIARKYQEWSADPKMAKYLRPATLFNRTKFDQYIGECVNA